jgi:hypothetical protein
MLVENIRSMIHYPKKLHSTEVSMDPQVVCGLYITGLWVKELVSNINMAVY